MPFTSTQKKEAYKKLQDEVKDFVMDNETTELIDNLLVEAGLSEEERDLADTEIFNSMLELQGLESVIKNIAEITKKDGAEFENLKVNLQEKIFGEIEKIKRETGYKQNTVIQEKPSNNIGNSFEQIILNQAIAMQPAREEGEGGRGTSNEIRDTTRNQVPENLPTEDFKPESSTPNYSGNDPYREPVE